MLLGCAPWEHLVAMTFQLGTVTLTLDSLVDFSAPISANVLQTDMLTLVGDKGVH